MKKLKKLTGTALLVCLLAGSLPKSILAANSTNEFKVGTLYLKKHGDHGRPIVLIPGLACGGWVWDETVARLKRDHVIFVVTLAGFDGTPPAPGKLMDLADDSLAELVRAEHLGQPVLIGHSLGGTLAIQFAEKHPNELSGVIAVDGLPIFPTTELMPAEQRLQIAADTLKRMAGVSKQQFASQQVQFMKNALLNETKAGEVATKTSRSDAGATAAYMSEDLALDLRPGLTSIKVPVLEISPFNAPDLLNSPMRVDEQGKTAYYTRLLAGTAKLQVISISPARHFVMYDQPEKFAAAVDKFLAALPIR